MVDKNLSSDEELNYNDEFADFDNTLERRPQEMDKGTFEKRNDPKQILKDLKMQLLNVYEKEVNTTNDETGEQKVSKKIVRIPGTEPLCSKQGVQEIVSYMQNYINGHMVQSNFLDLKDFKDYMIHAAQDITHHFTAKRKDWALSISQLDILISRMVNIIDGFLRRALFNKERESYGETYKENYNRSPTMTPESPGWMKRFYNAVTRW